jgi:DNA polymerase-3 subunit gamma/tau
MSYLVLARKWRPQRFEEIAGQSHITRVLSNAIRTNRIAHAYLFTGIRGVGKTTAARVLAKALNCVKGPTPEPCNECDHCKEIAAGNSMDVCEVDGASNRGIDEVRQIIENARYQPAKCRFKIYIIDEVHQVTKEAFNALLKTLEEPPPFVKFILATTEAHRLPETILSRCQRFDFRRVSLREMVQRLKEIADAEGLRITDGALLLVAREGDGSMRDAQSLLEQILSYVDPKEAGEESGRKIDEALLEDILGIAERKILYDLSSGIFGGEAKRCLDIVARVANQGLDIVRLTRDLVEHFRNLLVVAVAAGKQPETKDPEGFRLLLDLPDQEMEDLKKQAAGVTPDLLMDYFDILAAGEEEVARSSYPRFALEALLVRLSTLPKTLPVAEVIGRLEALEKRLSTGEARPPRPDNRSAQAEPRPEAPEKAGPPARDLAGSDMTDVWKQFVAFVNKEKKLLGSYLEKVTPVNVVPGEIKIESDDRMGYLKDPENIAFLKDFARRFFSRETIVSVFASPAKTPAASAGGTMEKTVSANPDMVQEAMRIFGGSIKEVRSARPRRTLTD